MASCRYFSSIVEASSIVAKRLVDGLESKLRREERTRTSAGHGVYREYRGCHQFVAQNEVVQLVELCALQRRPGASRCGDSRPRCVPRIPEKPRSRCLPMRQQVLVGLDQHSRLLIKFVLVNRVRPNSWALVVRAERSVALTRTGFLMIDFCLASGHWRSKDFTKSGFSGHNCYRFDEFFTVIVEM